MSREGKTSKRTYAKHPKLVSFILYVAGLVFAAFSLRSLQVSPFLSIGFLVTAAALMLTGLERARKLIKKVKESNPVVYLVLLLLVFGLFSGLIPGVQGIDSTFGKASVGAGMHYFGETKRSCRYYLFENGTINSITYYVAADKNWNNMTLALYSDNAGLPDALLGQTLEESQTLGWHEINLTVPYVAEAGYYWLTAIIQVDGNTAYDEGATNQTLQQTVTYASEPSDPWGSVDNNYNWAISIYASYTPEGGATTLTINSNVTTIISLDGTLHTNVTSEEFGVSLNKVHNISTYAAIEKDNQIYTFTHWEDDSTDPIRQINITEATEITATYEIADKAALSTWFGTTVFHETMGFRTAPTAEKQAIVNRMKNLGNRILMYTQPDGWITYSLKAQVEEFTTLAQAKGMRVVWGMHPQGYVDGANWNTYVSDVLDVAADAETAGIQEFWVGCELGMDSHRGSWTQAELVEHVLQLINSTKQVFSGEVSYDGFWWFEPEAWNAVKLDERFPDKIFFSTYESYDTWKEKVDYMKASFGVKFNIGEYGSVFDEWGNETSYYDNQFLNKTAYLNTIGVPEAYAFDYKELSDSGFGLWTMSTNQTKLSAAILSKYSRPNIFASQTIEDYNTTLANAGNPYVLNGTNYVTALSWTGANVLGFSVSAPTDITSVTVINTTDFGEPDVVSGATSWNYNSGILTITKLHSSVAAITVTFVYEIPHWPEGPIVPETTSFTPFWQWLQEGDFLGFLQAIYINVFQSPDIFYGLIFMLVFGAIYLRTKSLPLLVILWLLIGGTLVVLIPIVSGLGIVLIIMGISGLLFQLFRPHSSSY